MTTSLDAIPAALGPLMSRLIIAGCSRRKAATKVPLPALDLYQGGSIPWLRARTSRDPRLRARIRILSAVHGLMPAEEPLLPYDRQLDRDSAARLAPEVTAALASDWTSTGRPQEILLITEPLYLVPLAAILATPAKIHWIPDPYDSSPADRILDQWGWP